MPRTQHYASILVVWNHIFKSHAGGNCEHEHCNLMVRELMQIRGQRHPTLSGETMALFPPWLPGDSLIHLSEDVTSNVQKGKGRGRKANKISWCPITGWQIISRMFILIFVTVNVLTLFNFLLCVATTSLLLQSSGAHHCFPHMPMLSSLRASAHIHTYPLSVATNLYSLF